MQRLQYYRVSHLGKRPSLVKAANMSQAAEFYMQQFVSKYGLSIVKSNCIVNSLLNSKVKNE